MPASTSPDPASRPRTIAELAEEIQAHDDMQKLTSETDLKQFLRVAEKHRKLARAYKETGDNEKAFVGFGIVATLVLEKIPTHNEYLEVLTQAQRHNLALNGQDMLEELGGLKPSLVARYERWEEQESSRRSSTPSQRSAPGDTPSDSWQHRRYHVDSSSDSWSDVAAVGARNETGHPAVRRKGHDRAGDSVQYPPVREEMRQLEEDLSRKRRLDRNAHAVRPRERDEPHASYTRSSVTTATTSSQENIIGPISAMSLTDLPPGFVPQQIYPVSPPTPPTPIFVPSHGFVPTGLPPDNVTISAPAIRRAQTWIPVSPPTPPSPISRPSEGFVPTSLPPGNVTLSAPAIPRAHSSRHSDPSPHRPEEYDHYPGLLPPLFIPEAHFVARAEPSVWDTAPDSQTDNTNLYTSWTAELGAENRDAFHSNV